MRNFPVFCLANAARRFTLVPGMKRFFRKAAIWLARLGAVLVVLLILFYAEEDWRGARDWAACQRELAAKGESLDLRQLAPPGKPEDDLSKVPIFAELYNKDVASSARIHQINPYLKSDDSADPPKYSGYQAGKPLDLASWQKYYRSRPDSKLTAQQGTPAQDILLVLGRFEQQFDDVASALGKPNASFPIDYDEPFKTHLGPATSIIRLSQFLQLRGIAHLENHETDLSEKDYLASFSLTGPLQRRDFVVDYLISMAVRAVDEAILWEGLHRHVWNATQLEEMESDLGKIDMTELGKKAFRVERAGGVREYSLPEREAKRINDLLAITGDDDDQFCLLPLFWLRPGGWHQQDEVCYVKQQQSRIDAINPIDGKVNRDSFRILPANTFLDMIKAFYVPFATLAAPVNQNIGSRIAHAETNRRLARLACRLEEYRIAHGPYPDTLDALPDLPAHLNQEVLSEAPLRYQRKGDGYLLYSIGWNQQDDGGVRATDDKEGDWVWPSP